MELPKAYEPKKYEDKIYSFWEKSGYFSPETPPSWIKNPDDQKRPYFSMVLPPPNVTGVLHMGHAAMLAIEDVMARYHRMKGDRTLWLPGTDHAAIATQTKVEKMFLDKGMKDPKNELGREKFLAEVDKFAKASHDIIVSQCKKMGSSLDWSREAFTLDEKRSLAVRTVFKKMYDDGLIEKGYRIVNWCPRCQSTLADDEVEYREQSAKVYTFKYSKDFPFAIATTRPETKLGDVAVAVNPKDKRYKKLIGKIFEVKKFAGGTDLKIKIISDPAVDMEFGTGAVGVTPAHSFVDYEMAQKNDLPIIKVINEDGKMTVEAGSAYAGLTPKEARKKVVEYLRANNLLVKEEDAPNNLSVCYRCGTSIEPLPSRQWFIRVEKEFKMGPSKIKGIKEGKKTTLKELMRTAVQSEQIKIVPDRFDKIYFHWVDNLHDWCISRQIWYGHRIPAWYKGDETFVGVEPPEGAEWRQDSDTLDTWFSSGIWTFSTLGWPNELEDFKNFHPTSVLETGYDILFFWVARMILMTAYTLGDIPFKTVYLHGLVRDESGRKMSKSIGNAIDPLVMVEQFGADATRLSLLLGNTPGNDLKLSEEKIAGFRNFTNKLWNIGRFMLTQINFGKDESARPATSADYWILQRLHDVAAETSKNIEQYNFSFAGEKLRDFTWNELADWYLEAAKIEGNKSGILRYILDTVLKLWHPYMPFVTEAVWSEIKNNQPLISEKWPEIKNDKTTEKIKEFELVKNIVTGIRSLRAEYKVEPAKRIDVSIGAGDKTDLLKNNTEILKGLARIEKLQIDKSAVKPDNSVGFVEGAVEVFIDLSGLVDFVKEKIRLQKEISEIEPYVTGLKKKISNKEFVKNAPEEIVGKEKQKLAEAEEKIGKIKNQLKNLPC